MILNRYVIRSNELRRLLVNSLCRFANLTEQFLGVERLQNRLREDE